MKGIILAGGNSTRLYPATMALCKQLLPIFDKPMIYYPLSLLMLAGIKEILIISTSQDLPRFKKMLGDGSQIGLNLFYQVQPKPEGLAQALILGEKFIDRQPVCLILGDNIFFGHQLPSILEKCSLLKEGALIFGYRVKDPSQYGVVTFSEKFKALNIEEKPKKPQSSYAVPGIYFYDEYASEMAKRLKPSSRNELEITDLNNLYLEQNRLYVQVLGRGYAWLDTGTFDDLYKASSFVQTIQERQGIKIACIEEIAYRKKYIDEKALYLLSLRYKNEYGEYLRRILKEEA